jgi:iron-sulfur cluster repair protein YtfE (RIC family)
MIIEDDVIHHPPTEALQIEVAPPSLLRDPLNFLFIEHYRHRQLCKILEHLATAPRFEPSLIATTLDFVRFDLALHVIDEEEDLFPLLRRRCEPEDDIEDVLGRLSGEHASDQDQAKAVRAVLEAALAEQRAIADFPGAAATLKTFSAHQRSHLALENAIVMPLARRRMTVADLDAMSKRLAARRGIVL